MLAAAHIIYIPGANGTDHIGRGAGAGRGAVLPRPQLSPPPCRGCAKVLADAHMGLQIYAAGTEGLMAQVAAAAHGGGPAA